MLLHTENTKCGFIKQPVTGTMGLPYSSRDQASFTAPSILPFPLPLPSVPYLSPSPFHFPSPHTHTHTHHLFPSHSIFTKTLSDPPLQYLRSAGTIIQFLSVRSRSALGVVPERWSAQWQLHWGDTARCCRGALLPWLCC